MVPTGFFGWNACVRQLALRLGCRDEICCMMTRPKACIGSANRGLAAGPRRDRMSIGTIILIILVIALLGGFSGIGGGPFYGTGYYGGGGLGLIIVILLILLLLGRI
jgi:hypothetical protein